MVTYLPLKYLFLEFLCKEDVWKKKIGQSHFGDLFAGNYLFMQVNPSALNIKYVFDRSFQVQNGNLPPSKVSLPRVLM